MKKPRLLMICPVRAEFKERAFPLGFYLASSVFSYNSFDVSCLDLTNHIDWKYIVSNSLSKFSPDIIGFSVCGAPNYDFTMDIVKLIRGYDKQIPIAIGGQHIRPPVKLNDQSIKLYSDFAENINVFFGNKIESLPIVSPNLSLISIINSYLPSIEISRGCWNKCKFCNADNNYIEKPIKEIEKELIKLSKLYNSGTILTIGGSNHLLSKWKNNGILSLLKEYNNHFKYNFNVGVESGWEIIWEELLQLDIWNIFIGLESICESSLINMNKTNNSIRYKRKASDLLSRCDTDGIYAFVTYIYGYPGDTINELNQLDEFIKSNASKYIVQLGDPCHAYPGTELILNKRYYENRGIKYHLTGKYENSCFYNLDISPTLTYAYLEDRLTKLFRSVNNNKASFYRCSGFRNFDKFSDFENNLHFYKKYFSAD